jgi:hypothetical protein
VREGGCWERGFLLKMWNGVIAESISSLSLSAGEPVIYSLSLIPERDLPFLPSVWKQSEEERGWELLFV